MRRVADSNPRPRTADSNLRRLRFESAGPNTVRVSIGSYGGLVNELLSFSTYRCDHWSRLPNGASGGHSRCGSRRMVGLSRFSTLTALAPNECRQKLLSNTPCRRSVSSQT